MKYLAPYIFRVAISNNRIVKLEDGFVTFQYKESATDKTKSCTVTAEEFIRRFLQHVLPERFVKVRYYGLWSPSLRGLLEQARHQLAANVSQQEPSQRDSSVKEALNAQLCPGCGGEMRLVERLKAKRGEPE